MNLNKIENSIRSKSAKVYRFIANYKAIVLSLIIIIILVILIIGRNSDLIGFPFDANVWGGMSDWVMIGVTIITAIYIYRTLKSQEQTLAAQMKLLSVEQERFRNEIIPSFEAEYIQVDGLPEFFLLMCPSLKITLKSNLACNLKVTISKDSKFKLRKEDSPFTTNGINNIPSIIYKGYSFTIDLEHEDYKINLSEMPVILHANISLEYEDFNKNNYSQTVTYFIGHEKKLYVYSNEPTWRVME